jgi:hypothetical protein
MLYKANCADPYFSRALCFFSSGDSKQSTSFRALFANGLNALFTERAVLYAEDARCRTLLLGSSKRDPNPLTFRAADLVSAKEVQACR